MKKYEVQVCGDPEEFCLAFKDKWVKVGGHAITVGDYNFSAVPFNNIFRISEVSSGAKIFDTQVPNSIQSYEQTMLFLEVVVVPKLIQIIDKSNEIDPTLIKNQIDNLRKKSIELLGDKPKTKKINTELFKAELSDVLH